HSFPPTFRKRTSPPNPLLRTSRGRRGQTTHSRNRRSRIESEARALGVLPCERRSGLGLRRLRLQCCGGQQRPGRGRSPARVERQSRLNCHWIGSKWSGKI